jgi:hypothetical protein
MAVGDFDFSLSRDQIVRGALQKVGAVAIGDPISGEEFNYAVQQLNQMVKEWQTKDIFLWQLVPFTVTTTPNQATVSMPVDPVFIGIDSAAWVNGVNHEPIEPISWRDYNAIESKTDKGTIEKICLDKMRNGTLYIYPVPTVATQLRIVGVSKLKDWDTALSNGDFPEHWSLALTYNLASILCDDYGIPASEEARIMRKADYYFSRAKGSDRHGANVVRVKGAY